MVFKVEPIHRSYVREMRSLGRTMQYMAREIGINMITFKKKFHEEVEGYSGRVFKPSEDDRVKVSVMIAAGMHVDEIRAMVINPVTKKRIAPQTFEDCFANEIASAWSGLKKKALAAMVELCEDAEDEAVQLRAATSVWDRAPETKAAKDSNTGVIEVPECYPTIEDEESFIEEHNRSVQKPGDYEDDEDE